MKLNWILPLCLACAAASSAASTAKIPAPADRAYDGTLTLKVDLSDASRKIFTAQETIPVRQGALTLFYPKWIPGEHMPSGTIAGITGLHISGGGKALAWRRDLLDMFTLHLDVPEGVSTLELDFEFLSPSSGGDFGQSVSATPRIVDLEWNQVLFYPAGYWSRGIQVQPSVIVPQGWGYGTALEKSGEAAADGGIAFKPLSLENLVDSPLIAGLNFRRIDLAPGADVPVHMDLVADRPEDLNATDAQIESHRQLVQQAYKLFGAHHYGHYDFLFTLSDSTGHFGLEHHQSSDDRLGAEFFTDPDLYLAGGDLLPHEFVHSWNGKFRRPADLWTPNFNVPMQDDLLWVYEGLTQYLGDVLSARSGLWTAAQYRDALAATAAAMEQRPGRSWRPLQDTADEAQILYNTPMAWVNWQREVDFYPEGELLWLDVDTKIRELSQGKRSLDDFLHAFYGIEDGSYTVKTYGYDDVVAALNAVQPYEWNVFLQSRLQSTAPQAPLDGISRGGWKLVYTAEPSAFYKAVEKRHKYVNLLYSLGLVIDNDKDKGALADVLWGSPAFSAGLAPDMKIIAVNGEKYDDDLLKQAIKAAQGTDKSIELLVQNLDYFSTVKLDYHGGPRYPHLERAGDSEDRLDAIVQAKP